MLEAVLTFFAFATVLAVARAASGPCALLVPWLAVPLPAQTEWQMRIWSGRYGHAMTYDSARGRVVLFGGLRGHHTPYLADTWEWDGGTWIQRTPGTSPSARSRHALAYDSARGKVVLFGGWTGSPMSDTWEWDGSTWIQRNPPASPPARSGHALAYDSARARIVLFGGDANTGGPFRSDTWEWDGTTWTQRTPVASPIPRAGHGLAFHGARGRVVLFGGADNFSALSDTWEWDGRFWTRQTPAASPPSRADHALALDDGRGRIVLFGGAIATPPYHLSDTWEWDGTTWTQRTPAPGPSARAGHALAFDSARGRAILFGGNGGREPFRSDTWEWDGSAWTQRTPAPSPPGRLGHAVACDQARSRVLLFGGYASQYYWSDTWEWDGSSWTERTTATSPTGRSNHAMACDTARGRIVLFGGSISPALFVSDTWEWDGNTWTQRTPAVSPPARYAHALAFDSARGTVVLFGGSVGRSLSDTWEWDGNAWTQRTPAIGPSDRSYHALAYDSARGRVVLFGGNGGSIPLADTWEWDGSTWTRRTPPVSPPGRFGHSLAFDSARGRVVLFGGTILGGPFHTDTWEWDGSTWTQRTPAASPLPRREQALAYDSTRERVVLFGGSSEDNPTQLGDTWEYGPVNPASYAAFGSGCPGSAGVPSLAAQRGAGPWLGARMALQLGSLPPGNPAIVWLGRSRSSWGPIPLPLALGAVGMPGCSLLMSPDWSLAVLNQNGTATLFLDLPNDASLLRAAFYNQALVVDGTANPFGAIVSNGGQGSIGAR